jgi:16S rRNA (cytosine1402-N4)-methyltransferase
VTGIDRDPLALELAQGWARKYGDRISLVHGTFGTMDEAVEGVVDGVVLDLGVSSMQLDRPERGFSFLRDGPLDMRMSQAGVSAADIVNEASEAELADIIFHYGEDRAARRIARAIVRAREAGPIRTTLQFAAVVEAVLPRARPGQSHPATRTFQALRIAVNDEFGELVAGLEAAERVLAPGGKLAVVSFHSLEDRVVKRFLQERSDTGGGGSRHAPQEAARAPGFSLPLRKAIGPDADELDANPRARSAKLRVAVRTDAPARAADRRALGLPKIVSGGM